MMFFFVLHFSCIESDIFVLSEGVFRKRQNFRFFDGFGIGIGERNEMYFLCRYGFGIIIGSGRKLLFV